MGQQRLKDHEPEENRVVSCSPGKCEIITVLTRPFLNCKGKSGLCVCVVGYIRYKGYIRLP